MGKIFGISNNPVSTIDSALRPVSLKPPVRNIKIINIHSKDRAVMTEPVINRANEANYFIKMRNIGITDLFHDSSNRTIRLL